MIEFKEVRPGRENMDREEILELYRNDSKPCLRYRHLDYCACRAPPCRAEEKIYNLFENVFVGKISSVFDPVFLEGNLIDRILDLSSYQFYKYSDLFDYCSIPLRNDNNEEVSTLFRMTNRFL